jgi:hypothetical protein
LDHGVTAADIIRPVELGYGDWSKGLFADAEKKLLPAKEKIFRNPGLLVTDTKNLDSTFKGLVALALSQARLNKPKDSAETMMELIRIFRARPVSRTDWGRPAEDYWRAIAKPALAGGTGQLYVTTGNDYAVIFVDGQIRGIGKAEVADLVPGTHRVFVQVPSTAGVQYEVEIKANENTDVRTRWDVDASLTAADPWIGFVFATEAERNKEAVFAGELAERWGGQGVVAVVDTLRIQGELMLVGTLYQSGGKIVRGAVTALGPNAAAQIKQLAKYLADGTVGTSLKLIPEARGDQSTVASVSSMSAPTEHHSKVLPFVVIGAGAAAITVGSIMYARDPYELHRPGSGDKEDAFLDVMLGGSVVLGGGTYLWLREAQSRSMLTAGALAAGVASIAAGAELYFTSQTPTPSEPPRIRDTAAEGVIFGGAGLVLTGVGAWLWHREGSSATTHWQHSSVRPLAPVVAVGSSYTFVGWTGGF